MFFQDTEPSSTAEIASCSADGRGGGTTPRLGWKHQGLPGAARFSLRRKGLTITRETKSFMSETKTSELLSVSFWGEIQRASLVGSDGKGLLVWPRVVITDDITVFTFFKGALRLLAHEIIAKTRAVPPSVGWRGIG